MIGQRHDRHRWLSPAHKPDQSDSLWESLNLGAPEATKWMRSGVCMETDPEAFFPEKGKPTATAKAVCVGCPVRPECLEYALDGNERFGVWGGLSERERRPLLRQRRKVDEGGVDRRVA
jgi:WhiB family redox-sensing transcriptional regulator